ncbi:MAG: class I mannose-6-phosphate isomerase [Bacteroidales bacterium]|nr:class I mannose-6-phosphate isomerase [Bacteroidales bacterium]
MQLYPLKFKAIPKTKIWGGNRLRNITNHNFNVDNIGETWDIAAFADTDTEITNGFLAENTLSEILEVYMSDLIGDKLYSLYGNRFPLLVKLIDATDKLSVQVHPNDEIAQKNGESNGKTEMWYVLDATDDAEIILGFNKDINKEELKEHINTKTLTNILSRKQVKKGDIAFIPAGTIHAIGKGCTILEIQQSSDTTYRLHDFDRLQSNGKPRELHIKEALDAIDYAHWQHDIIHTNNINNNETIIDSDYFTCEIIKCTKDITLDCSELDSFIILSVTNGSVDLLSGKNKTTLNFGESCLIPAALNSLELHPNKQTTLLKTFIK